jgi:hypothetical protein
LFALVYFIFDEEILAIFDLNIVPSQTANFLFFYSYYFYWGSQPKASSPIPPNITEILIEYKIREITLGSRLGGVEV